MEEDIGCVVHNYGCAHAPGPAVAHLVLSPLPFRVLTLYCHCVLVQRTLASTWILLLDWLARGIYTLVFCAEIELGKSAIYALLSRCRKCRDLRALGAEKNCESWDPSQKNRNSSPDDGLTLL